MFRFLIIALLWLPTLTQAKEAPVILIMGDSVSAAYGMTPQQGWVALLQARINSQGYPHQIINASISGETSLGGLNRLPPLIRRHRPAIVILELGTNDGLQGQPLAQIRYNLASMVAQIQNAGAKPLLLGMRLPPNYGPGYTRQFHEIFQDVAQRYKIAKVPFVLEGIAGIPALTQEDGLHPAANAQARVLENVWPRLQPMLKR